MPSDSHKNLVLNVYKCLPTCQLITWRICVLSRLGKVNTLVIAYTVPNELNCLLLHLNFDTKTAISAEVASSLAWLTLKNS